MSEKYEASWHEKPRTKQREVKFVTKLPNGMTSIDFGPQPEIYGDHDCVLLTQESIEKYGLNNLQTDTKLEITEDQDGKVLDIKFIE